MCPCQSPSVPAADPLHGPAGQGVPKRPAAALVLSFLVAFFPKCPMCWVAYSAGLGIASSFWIPYIGYLYPLLFALLALHLLSLARRASRTGWEPSLVSLGGALTLLVGHRWFPQLHWLLYFGILSVFGGSIWNSIAVKRPPRRQHNPVRNDPVLDAETCCLQQAPH